MKTGTSLRALTPPLVTKSLFLATLLLVGGVSACDADHIREVIEAGKGGPSKGNDASVPPAPGLTCGVTTGFKCPGLGNCDYPIEGCDPTKGGADCGGICQCVEKVLCAKGLVFDSSPKVCACVEVSPPPPVCGPVCDLYCAYGHVLDAQGCELCGCNPPPVDKVSCGGFAGIACPGGGKCADDPTDSCDPKAGGADCGGICQCVQTVACVQGAKFDNSPHVCACVGQVVPPPPPPVCGPVCQIFCEYGNVLDAAGCPTCKCNPAPAADPCATVRCKAGTHCEASPVMCVKAPCPPVAACVPDAPAPGTDLCAKLTCAVGSHCVVVAPPCAPGAGTCPLQATCVLDAARVRCGGIAGVTCPGGGQCVDDPTDTCDPKTGGADCGGICQCIQTVACIKGKTFNSSPKVCSCG